MKYNRMMWGLVALVVLLTISVSLGTFDSHSQQKSGAAPQPTLNPEKGGEDLTKYAVAEYNAPQAENALDREDRRKKSERYDGMTFVFANPHPDDGASTLFEEKPLPPGIPVDESDLIVVGMVRNACAYMSNDKGNVYTEYEVQIDEILKARSKELIASPGSIVAGRTGGYVRYPNGQKVLYRIAGQGLPEVGRGYILFLTTDNKSPNYRILTGYGLKQNEVIPLDSGRRFEEFKTAGQSGLMKAIREKISESSRAKKS